MLVHLIDMDVVNARFLWKRIKDDFKKDKELLNTWNLCKALSKRSYDQAFKLLKGASKGSASDIIKGLKKSLKRVLRYISIPTEIHETYSRLDYKQFKSMMGMGKSADSKVKALLSAVNLQLTSDGKFVYSNDQAISGAMQ